MLETWNNLSVAIGDVLLGWLLRLPRDLTLVMVATLTALLLIGIRRLTTPQDRLRRAAEDSTRLKQLIKEARQEKDQAALARYRHTRSLVGLVKLKAEGWPLLVSLLPIGILATWALFRLEYLPVRPGEPVGLALYTPVTAAGEIVHVVPLEGVVVDGTWVQRVRAVTDDGPPHGLATWHLKAGGDLQPYRLTLRLKDRSFEREFIVGRRTYALPVVDHGDDYVSEWKREPYCWLGRVSGWDAIGLPAWLIGYVVMVVPITLLLKRALGVY
jgi:hypothetical protein